MAANPNTNNNAGPLLLPESGPTACHENLPSSPTPRRYTEENYSKIRDVERELANLTLEMKLIAGQKKAGMCLLFLHLHYEHLSMSLPMHHSFFSYSIST
ncbi:hypothetical protein Pfo_024403 [Paulownia fortunei]|nr:hypothetical protein Pfo_024403 [Paulownia fortunei]